MSTLYSFSPWLILTPDKKQFPSLEDTVFCDVIIVGGGIVGATTAWYLTQAGYSVVLLEKNHLATGDTAATTGFLTKAPDSSMKYLAQMYGKQFIYQLVTQANNAQQDIFDIIQKQRISCEFSRCNTYFGSYEKNNTILAKEWISMKEAIKDAEFITNISDTRIPFAEAIRLKGEGQFNPRSFILSLLQKSKVKTYEESEALDFIIKDTVTVKTERGIVIAKKLVIATGYPHSYFQELSHLITHFTTYVIAARFEEAPLTNDLFWDTLDPYFYFRMIDTHTVIVGGCDEKLPKPQKRLKDPYQKLQQFLQSHFSGAFNIAHQWSGSLFETIDKLPFAFEHPHYVNRVYIATGFAGNGLVYGTLAAKTIVSLISEKVSDSAELLSYTRTKSSIQKPIQKSTQTLPKNKEGFIPIASIDELQEHTTICKKVGNLPLMIIKDKDQYFSLHNTCSHAGGSLCEGNYENGIIQCPLHGARFDVKTGAVISPPAVRPQAIYPIKIQGETLMVNTSISSQSSSPTIPPSPSYHFLSRRKQLIVIAIFSFIFWGIQFYYQYSVLTAKDLKIALIRSFALSGETLIGGALFSSAVFKWFPQTAVYWTIRRYLGISGFVFIFFHVAATMQFIFNYNLKSVYYSLNPLENPVVFGSIAYPIFFIMAATSTDWAVKKLTPRIWKTIHRLVYIAYVSSIFHFILINPRALNNPFGYILIAITILAIFGQLFWFIKIASQKKFRSLGSLVGVTLILATLIIVYLIYQQYLIR